jgi:hypothetical protein
MAVFLTESHALFEETTMIETTFTLRGTKLGCDEATQLLNFSCECIALITSRKFANPSLFTQGEADCLRLNAVDAVHLAFQLNPSLRKAGEEPIWKPLEDKIGAANCEAYMYMGSAAERAIIHLYKHRDSRRYLNLDESGQCYIYVPDTQGNEHYLPISDIEALSRVA